MRSLADRLRVERALRAIGYAALALWIALAAWPTGKGAAIVRGDALPQSLPRLTSVEPADSVHVLLDTVPDPVHLSWLGALRGAGVGMSWSMPSPKVVALETYRAAEPGARVVVLAATSSGVSTLSDALGPVDTIAGARGPTTLRLASVEGDVTLLAGAQPARSSVGSATAPRRVFVTGAATWESKFVITALEEAGWNVDSRVFVRPDHDVVQGTGRPALDTGRYAAVVLLDSAGAESARGVEEFVRSGGGVVIAGDANRARRVASVTGWRAGRREVAPLGTLPGDTAWRGQSRVPLATLERVASIALEARDGAPLVMARRHYAGRVLGIGYDETWRWRMAGSGDAVAEHRAWWSRAVASVAARPASGGAVAGSAPLALVHQALDAPTARAETLASRFPGRLISALLGLTVLGALLAEWLLRRSRGGR